MKKIIKYMCVLTSFFAFIGCSKEEKFLQKNKVIYYGTNEFIEFEKNATIPLNKAWNIQKKYALDRNVNPENWLFFFVINDFYVFTSILQPKIPNASTGGIWVNSKTGEIKEIKSDINLKYKDAYNGDGDNFLF